MDADTANYIEHNRLTAAIARQYPELAHFDADARWDEGTRAVEARRGAVAVRRADAAELDGCTERDGIAGPDGRVDPHAPTGNALGDAWCALCGERLILTGYAGALGYVP